MSQPLVYYILSLQGGVDEFLERLHRYDIPSEYYMEVIGSRKQEYTRTVFPSRARLYNLIREVYPDLHANKEAYARQELAKGKSAGQVADEMGITRRTIQNWKKKWKAAEDEAAPA